MRLFLKVLIWLLAVAAALFALLLVWIMTHTNDSAAPGEGSGLYSWSYTVSGGMDGGTLEISAEYSEKTGRTVVTRAEKKTHSSVQRTRRRRADASLLDEIGEIVSEYGMREWDGLAMSGLQVPDAAAVRVTLRYGEGSRYSFSSSQELPEGWAEGVEKINSIILSALDG